MIRYVVAKLNGSWELWPILDGDESILPEFEQRVLGAYTFLDAIQILNCSTD